jgi:type IV pilus assembly protein PilW
MTSILSSPQASKGFTLVEAMIAMAITVTVVAGVLSTYAQLRGTYRVNERIARIQEQGRVALSTIESDIELAGYYGFTNSAEAVRFVRGASPHATLATAAQMRQFALRPGEPNPAPVAGLPAGSHGCGVNFAVDVMSPVQGATGRPAFGREATCDAYRDRAQAGADGLTLRRVETVASAPEAGRIQVYASRLAGRTNQLMFADGRAPGVIDADHRIHNVVVRSYYIARDSVGQNAFPALRVKSLTRSGAAARFDDDEVMTGVEDLQVQFAVDAEGTGRATRYVNPDFADLPRMQVVAVRLWLRIRADEPEVGFDDAQTYRYGDVAYTPVGAERKFRRVLMSRTVALRNARTR